MSRTLGVCWMFLWITTAANVTAYYTLSNKSVSWHDAKSMGNFATPTIQVNTSTFSLAVNITSDLSEHERAWVGYYKKETAFAYVGCGILTNATPKVMLPISLNSPGNCFSLCKESHHSHYIGLNKDNCLCLGENLSGNVSLPYCNISLNGNWISGGVDSMSIYKTIKADITVTRESTVKKCLVFQRNKAIWWTKCSEIQRALCKKGADVIHNGDRFMPWKDYVKTCLKETNLPITFHDTFNSSNIHQAIGPSWTNVIHSDVIYKYLENWNEIGTDENVKYGYLIRRRYFTILKFTTNSSIRHRYLLETLPVTNPTSEQKRTTTTSHMPQKSTTRNTGITSLDTKWTTQNTSLPKESSSITTTQLKGPDSNTFSSTSSVNDGLISSTEAFQSKPQTNTPESSDVSIPVSVSVVAIFLIAVVILVITLKRRGKFQGICSKILAVENSSKSKTDKTRAVNNLYNESPVDDYDQISEFKDNNNLDVKPDLDVENCEYGHTYFILEPGSRESHTDGNISDSRIDGAERNDDYNTLHLNKTFAAKADNTYDTTEKAAIKLKALRDTGCEKESPKKLNGNEEDTYNHISRNPSKNSKTDNIYGVTDNQEDDYGDVHNGCEKNRHNGDDTYSHLNTTH